MKHTVFFFFFLIGCSCFGWQTANAQPVNQRGSWRTLAPMPVARQEVSAAVLDGKIYTIAGFTTEGNNSNTVSVYDPQANQWTAAAPLPIATNHNGAAVAQGKLYAFGGTTTRCFVYNPQTNSWADVAPMRFQHGNTAAVGVIGGKIYVAGGTGIGMNQRELEVYDPATNQWSQLASMGVGRSHTVGGVIDGKFYVAGGRGALLTANVLEAYDPVTNQWRRLADLPTGRSGMAAAVVNGELYVIGGEIPRMFNEVEVYNPNTDRWTQLPPMPIAKHGIFGVTIDNVIYMPGGATLQGLGATTDNTAYVLNSAASVSAASYASAGLPAKSIIASFGVDLASGIQAASALPLPTELGGVSVRVTDTVGMTRNAPLFFVAPQQINWQIPPGTANGLATVQITNNSGRLTTSAVPVGAAAPAFFTAAATGRGAAVAQDAITFAQPPFNATRADGGPNVLLFYLTGLGADVTDADGNVATEVQVTVAGQAAQVLYAGRAPGLVGVNQLNLLLPVNLPAGTHTVRLQRGSASSNEVTIAIR